MAGKPLQRFHSISEFHQYRGLGSPAHPLISVVNLEEIRKWPETEISIVFDFYSIALKRNFPGRLRYGQQQYDFDDGILFFIAPGQVFSIEVHPEAALEQSGHMLLVHPDFLWSTPLAKGIQQYAYFDYAVNEALFLSEKEEAVMTSLMQSIMQEARANIDHFSQSIIIAHLTLLFSYAERFYHRQFITRKITNHSILERLEDLLKEYFNNEDLVIKGLPSVQYVAAQLNVSPGYLSGLLKVLTGQSTQQHIHDKLIEKAKEKLSTTSLSISEIAYALGFEHPQSFSKLFKIKTNVSPLEFRQTFN